MTTPDGGMEDALRRELTEALGRIEPGTEGLERIRARIGGRPPRPWLLSFAADTLGAARHWVWRWSWHWNPAWTAALPAPAASALARVPRLPLPRLRLLPGPGEPLRAGQSHPARTAGRFDVSWLRPVAVLAAV